ncbi:hypothetical protein M9434_003375 [Picochlorum sp. BPE23]|nr:hypothetical protein M9434_003375 [Picochlorum sp. BPE23]
MSGVLSIFRSRLSWRRFGLLKILTLCTAYFCFMNQKFSRIAFNFRKEATQRRGVVYFGYSNDISLVQGYLETIIRSSKGIRQYSPSLPIMLFTNFNYSGAEFDHIYIIPDDLVLPGRQWWTRISLLAMTKFEETISIDSDRVICNPIESVFQYLSEYDMLGVSVGILPGLDNGVMVYRKSAKFSHLVELWKEEQLKIGKDADDQQSLAKAIDRLTDFKVGVLDQSWQMKYIPVRGQNWRNTTMRRSLVIHNPVKIAASAKCPDQSNSSVTRIYMGNIFNETKWKIGFSLHECNQYLNDTCFHPELDWGQQSQVIERGEYLSKYCSREKYSE